MEIGTIITTTIALVSPYLVKSGEAMAKKIGEELWNTIKEPFTKKEDKALIKKVEAVPNKENLQLLEVELMDKLQTDNQFFQKLSDKIKSIQKESSINFRQINQGDKSLYFEKNEGTININ